MTDTMSIQQMRREDPEAYRAYCRERYAWKMKNVPGFAEKHRQKAKRWRSKNAHKLPSETRKSKLRKFGLTIEDYERMLLEQDGVCAICRRPETARNQHGPIRLSVDHCHKTNRVRGLLCGNCNNGIGRFKDDPLILQSATDYLRRPPDDW